MWACWLPKCYISNVKYNLHNINYTVFIFNMYTYNVIDNVTCTTVASNNNYNKKY